MLKRTVQMHHRGMMFIALILLLLGPGSTMAFAQAQPDSAQTPAAAPQPSWTEGELIELDAVQIEGEIAQPNVTITVARQEPMFRELALERTPAQGLMDLELADPDAETAEAAKIKDWSEMLERPRQ